MTEEFLKEANLEYNFTKTKELKCGSNPHQNACLYSFDKTIDYQIIKGRELTYNNIKDSTLALEVLAEFYDVCAICVVNSSNISCAALGATLENTWDKVIDCDPTCYFKSTIALSREIDLKLAKKLSQLPFKVILAPSFSTDAVLEFEKNKTTKLVKINTALSQIPSYTKEEITLTPFGVLIQEKDTKELDPETFKVVTKKKPAQSEVEDMIFAFKVAKYAKSNAIVIAKDLRTLSVVSGEPNRICALESAISRVCDSTKDSIIASDGFFSSTDAIKIALQNRISSIIQPAGSVNDEEIIKMCDKYEISMISTAIRHIKH